MACSNGSSAHDAGTNGVRSGGRDATGDGFASAAEGGPSATDGGHPALRDGGHGTVPDSGQTSSGDTGVGSSVPTGHHLTHQTITVNGATRSYDVTLPLTCDASNLVPFVIILHGDTDTGASMYGPAFPIETAAAAAGDTAIFLYPNGLNNNQNGSAWDIYDDPGAYPYTTPSPTGNKDVDFFDALLAYFQSSSCADPQKVFVTGFSNGGYMANQLARWRSSVIYGNAPQSGGPPAGSSTPSSDYQPPFFCVGTTSSVPTLIIHGAVDGVVDPSLSQQSASYWDMANECANSSADCSPSTSSLVAPPATPTTATSPSPCVQSSGCKTGYPVVLCEIPGMGHSIWSHAAPTIWAFFSGK